MRIYKVLDRRGRSCHGGTWKWSLPRDGQPGEWTPSVDVAPCRSGWHLCRGGAQLLDWIGPRVWIAEARGVVEHTDDKVVCESVRLVAPTSWDDRSARLFASDCAARVAHMCPDPRVAAAIEAARRHARGEIDDSALAAARAAAWAAVEAAWAAVEATAEAAAEAAVEAAAEVAAWAAAGAAAWAAVEAAAWVERAAERQWQARRLLRYVHGLPCRDVEVDR